MAQHCFAVWFSFLTDLSDIVMHEQQDNELQRLFHYDYLQEEMKLMKQDTIMYHFLLFR